MHGNLVFKIRLGVALAAAAVGLDAAEERLGLRRTDTDGEHPTGANGGRAPHWY